jgi:hypothetical protein
MAKKLNVKPGAGFYVFDLFMSALFLFILYSTYVYLGNLQNCGCVGNQLSVSHLKNVELFFVIVSAIGLIGKLIMYAFNISIYQTLLSNTVLKGIFIIYSFILIFLWFYFLYNAYQFIFSTLKDCKCAQSWQEYVIYAQCIIYLLCVLSLFITLFFKK